MIVKFVLFLLIAIQVNCDNSPIEKEKVLLNQSLKNLRQEYNELLENVDKLVKDFAGKFGKAGNLEGFVPQIAEQKFEALPITPPESSKPILPRSRRFALNVESVKTNLNQAHPLALVEDLPHTDLGFNENTDKSTVKLKNTEPNSKVNQLEDVMLKNQVSVTDEEESFVSAKGPTKVHPLFTFRKGKPSQTTQNVRS